MTHTHIHTFILRHFVQIAVGGERAQPPPHNGNGSMSGIDAHEPASRSNSLPQAHRLVVHFGWFFWSLPELSVSEENERLRHQQPKAKKWQTKHPISQPMRQINVKSRNSSARVAKEKLPIPMGTFMIPPVHCYGTPFAVASMRWLHWRCRQHVESSLFHLSAKWTRIRTRLGCGRFFSISIFFLNYHPIAIHGFCKSRVHFVCHYIKWKVAASYKLMLFSERYTIILYFY